MLLKRVHLFALILTAVSTVWAEDMVVIKVEDENKDQYLVAVWVHEPDDLLQNTYTLHHCNGELICQLPLVGINANNSSLIALVNNDFDYIPFTFVVDELMTEVTQLVLSTLRRSPVKLISHLTSRFK